MATRRTKSVQDAEPVPESSLKPQAGDTAAISRRWLAPVAVAVATVISIAVYLLRYDRVAGFTVDDAWYILLGKAVATGHGYTLMNSPTPGIRPFYPPGFPFLLSLVFRVAPNFPNNLWLLKGVSIAAMFAMGAAAYFYFTRQRKVTSWVAGAMAVVIVLNPVFVFFATSSVMSEPVFTFVQLLAVVVIERAVSEGSGKRAMLFAALGGALSSYVFLTRSMGVSLLIAAVLYFAWNRLWRPAAAFALVCGLLLGPWMIYSRLHAPTAEQRAEQGGYITYPYGEQFWMKTAGNPYAGNVTAGDIPARVLDNLWQMAGEEAGRIFATPVYRAPRLSGFEFQGFKSGTGILAILLTLLILLGYVSAVRERITVAELVLPMSVGVISLWPWYPLRLLIPYLPFLMFYLVRGLQVLQQLGPKAKERSSPRPTFALTLLGLVLAFYAYDHAAYIAAKSESSPDQQPAWLVKYAESEDVLNWMKANMPRDGGVAVSSNPALVYLHTGMKTISGGNVKESWERWKTINVRYLAFVGYPSPMPPPGPAEKAFTQLYPAASETAARPRRPSRLSDEEARFEVKWNNRVVDLGPPDSRREWAAGNQQSGAK